MRYLTLAEVFDLHGRVIEKSGGASGVRDLGGVEYAVAQRIGSRNSTMTDADLISNRKNRCSTQSTKH